MLKLRSYLRAPALYILRGTGNTQILNLSSPIQHLSRGLKSVISPEDPGAPRFAKGVNYNEAISELTKLLNEPSVSPWRLTQDANGIQKRYRFKTFRTTWAFMNSVAEHCMAERHHPEWTNVRIIKVLEDAC
ncbi:uncharacterized protein V1513DRAFT_382765 [Lipomyces chichibuensis]|uniref:uncharacterized protein n=1 Tax=Lipomyces chichibuensis TaxID=1546026 RepID=UPI003343EC7D